MTYTTFPPIHLQISLITRFIIRPLGQASALPTCSSQPQDVVDDPDNRSQFGD